MDGWINCLISPQLGFVFVAERLKFHKTFGTDRPTDKVSYRSSLPELKSSGIFHFKGETPQWKKFLSAKNDEIYSVRYRSSNSCQTAVQNSLEG